jgi:ATPase subunit of ABC transporter with duplicated ATPase domains
MRHRSTKKKEDLAYSLLGICEVFMPLLYGEGENAWTRLENEVSRRYGRRIDLERPPGLADGTQHSSSEPSYIAVMGITGSGKSTLISKITGEGLEIGRELVSCAYIHLSSVGFTSLLRIRLIHHLSLGTSEVESFSFEYDSQVVHLIDTPGFDHSKVWLAIVRTY